MCIDTRSLFERVPTLSLYTELQDYIPLRSPLKTTFLLHFVRLTVRDYSRGSAFWERIASSTLQGFSRWLRRRPFVRIAFSNKFSRGRGRCWACDLVFRGVRASIPRRLSTETCLSDGVTLNRQPRTGTIGPSAETFRLATRKSAISQLRRVVVLERPPLPRCCWGTFFHYQPLLALRYRQTLVAAAVSDLLRLKTNVSRQCLSAVLQMTKKLCFSSSFESNRRSSTKMRLRTERDKYQGKSERDLILIA